MSKRQWNRLFLVLGAIISFLAVQLQQPLAEPAPVPQAQVPITIDDDAWAVTRVVDGDTVVVLRDDEEMKVRIIGVNAPESVDPRRPVECFGCEASARLKDLLTGETVTLVEDPSQGSTDKYGRALRYVENDGVDVGLQLITDGFAYEYTYRTPYERQSEYKTAQRTAEAAGAGLWSKEAACK